MKALMTNRLNMRYSNAVIVLKTVEYIKFYCERTENAAM